MDPDRILPSEAFTNTSGGMPLPMTHISNDELAALREDKARLDWLDAHCEVTISTADEGADMVGFNATLNPATAGKLRSLIDQVKLAHP